MLVHAFLLFMHLHMLLSPWICCKSDLDTIFIAVNVVAPGEKQEGNSSKTISRYEFMEAIVRIALRKFNKMTPSNALKQLLDNYIIENANWDDTRKWRIEKLWLEQIDTIYKNYLSALKWIYAKHVGRYTLPGRPKEMSLEEFQVHISF